jgi:hypothetical protein
VAAKILNCCTVQAHGNIRPPHPRHALSIQLIILPVNDILEIKDTGIIVVLTREHRLVHIRWMQIRERMLVSIPATEAHIQSTHKGSSTIDQAQLFVMSPIENNILVHPVQSLQSVL